MMIVTRCLSILTRAFEIGGSSDKIKQTFREAELLFYFPIGLAAKMCRELMKGGRVNASAPL